MEFMMMKIRNQKLFIVSGLVLALLSGQAMAGGGGTEFQNVYDLISGWSNGVLGQTLGIASLLVGLGMGVIKQSVMAAVVGISIAMVAAYGPDIVAGVVSSGLAVTTVI